MKTIEVAELLAVPFYALTYLIRLRKVSPQKDISGDFVWSSQDIAAARQVLQNRKRGGPVHAA